MSSGPWRSLVAAGSLLCLGACADGSAQAPAPTTEPAPASATSEVAGNELVETGPVDTAAAGSSPVADDTVDQDQPTEPTGPTTPGSATVGTAVTASTVATTTIVADPDCAPVVALAEAVAVADGLDFSLAWPELQAAVAASSDAAAQSYRDVLDVAPADVDAALEVLADYNTDLGATARAATSLTEFQATVSAPDNALLDATATVDDYMRAACSIGLSVV